MTPRRMPLSIDKTERIKIVLLLESYMNWIREVKGYCEAYIAVIVSEPIVHKIDIHGHRSRFGRDGDLVVVGGDSSSVRS